MIRVMIVEDQAMVRGALAALLMLEGDIDVIAGAPDGETALEHIAEVAPDVVLMDIELPGINGIEALQQMKAIAPHVRCIVLTTFGRPGYLRAAMDAGAVGFLVKDAPATDLAAAIRNVVAGGKAIDPELARAALAVGPNPLTPRQRDVLRLARLGRSVSAMANELFLTEGTVRNYLSEAIAATGGSNRTEALRIAEERGWL